MRVELLYFDGCPHYQRLLPRLTGLIEETAPGADLVLRRIETAEQAEREGFLGSPSVRVEGVDVDPGAADRNEYGLECRLYRTGEATSPVPPDAWIRDALERAL
jgi:hypothetical protein